MTTHGTITLQEYAAQVERAREFLGGPGHIDPVLFAETLDSLDVLLRPCNTSNGCDDPLAASCS